MNWRIRHKSTGRINVFDDIQSLAMGFGFGAVGGAILADLLNLAMFETVFFFLGGLAGAIIASGYFGDLGMGFDEIFQ